MIGKLRVAMVLASACCFIASSAVQESPISKRMADSAMQRWPDGQIAANGNKLEDWAYDKNTLLAGFAAQWQNTANPNYFHYIERSMDRLVTDDGTIPSYRPDELSLDEIALGSQLLLLYGRTRKEKYYDAMVSSAGS